jgi:CIC family chloride channel protein
MTSELRSFGRRTRLVVLWSALVGVVTGTLVAGFDLVVEDGMLRWLFDQPLWLIALAPTVGLAATAIVLSTIGQNASPATTDAYIVAFHGRETLGLRHALPRALGAVATLGSGGAMGLEGPSLFFGASTGAFLQRRLSRFVRGADPNLLLVAGAAAGVAAIFKAPATGAVFALEVPYQDDLARRMLLPALVGAASGYLAFAVFQGTTPLFEVSGSPPFSFADLAGAAVLGVAAGLGARVFASAIRGAKQLVARVDVRVRIAFAGLALAALFATGQALTGESIVLGPGGAALRWAVAPDRSVQLLLAVMVLRCLATSATVAGGGVGGLFIPLVVAGGCLGSAASELVTAADSTLFPVLGVAAFLGAGYRTPLAAVMFVAETTGQPGFIVPGVIAAVVAELAMTRASVSAYQVAATP